jgi:hypothetical protein
MILAHRSRQTYRLRNDKSQEAVVRSSIEQTFFEQALFEQTFFQRTSFEQTSRRTAL